MYLLLPLLLLVRVTLLFSMKDYFDDFFFIHNLYEEEKKRHSKTRTIFNNTLNKQRLFIYHVLM